MLFCSRAFRLCLAVVFAMSVALSAAACSGLSDPSQNRNDDIQDTVEPSTQNVYAFNVSKNGEYSITLTALSNPNVTIGIASGVLATASDCVVTMGQNNLVKLNAVALSGAIDKGNSYCFIVYDNGTLAAPVNYTVRLSHP